MNQKDQKDKEEKFFKILINYIEYLNYNGFNLGQFNQNEQFYNKLYELTDLEKNEQNKEIMGKFIEQNKKETFKLDMIALTIKNLKLIDEKFFLEFKNRNRNGCMHRIAKYFNLKFNSMISYSKIKNDYTIDFKDKITENIFDIMEFSEGYFELLKPSNNKKLIVNWEIDCLIFNKFIEIIKLFPEQTCGKNNNGDTALSIFLKAISTNNNSTFGGYVYGGIGGDDAKEKEKKKYLFSKILFYILKQNKNKMLFFEPKIGQKNFLNNLNNQSNFVYLLNILGENEMPNHIHLEIDNIIKKSHKLMDCNQFFQENYQKLILERKIDEVKNVITNKIGGKKFI